MTPASLIRFFSPRTKSSLAVGCRKMAKSQGGGEVHVLEPETHYFVREIE